LDGAALQGGYPPTRAINRPTHQPTIQPQPTNHPPQVGSVDSLDQYDGRFEFASPGSLDRLQSLLDASHHSGSDGSSHRGRRYSPAATTTAGGGASAGQAAAGDYRDKSWNVPPPNFRFDFGGGARDNANGADTTAASAGASDAAAGSAGPAAAWPGLTAGAPPPALAGSAPRPLPLPFSGAARAGGHFDRRMHGASLYRNMLVNHHAGPAFLEPVKE
jgi:hypothetical protein